MVGEKEWVFSVTVTVLSRAAISQVMVFGQRHYVPGASEEQLLSHRSFSEIP